ncbi:MAG: 5-oxoprolinase subunit PxpB [Oscillospiraceae bacterium]|jgi:KipI family sensor histidine kinase inhibitor|nr:5-oxoprolinase subunit PxpB [Oscillospiraceae bacterium]
MRDERIEVTKMAYPQFHAAGDAAILVEFGSEINPESNASVRALSESLRRKPIRAITECVPAFCSLLINYDPCRLRYQALTRQLRKRLQGLSTEAAGSARVFAIPVCYNGEDLEFVARHANLSKEEVIRRHSAPEYLIYMLGFLPGFAYLGGLDPAIHTPRLQNPRTKIPAGAVGIGGEQTGIYPLASPGGWQLIGQTPVRPYDPQRAEPILYAAGDYIKFEPVTAAEYAALERRQAAGEQIWEVGRHG